MISRKLSTRISALIAILALAFTAQVAQAEPEHELVFGELTVQVNGGGSVTGTGINCGADCYDDESWFDNQAAPVNRLTATAGHGWGFGGWTGCTPVAGQPTKCDASYTEFGGDPVEASFYDVMAPGVYLHFPVMNAVLGNSAYAAVETGDNDRVVKVEYLLDGEVIETVTTGQFDVNLNLTAVSEGEHQIQARSYDPTGNNGITAARTITVDHSGPNVTLNSPIEATNAESVSFTFSSDSSDIDQTWCQIVRKGDDANHSACSPGEPFTASGLATGQWQFAVWTNDKVGNLTQVVHEFVIDRSAPIADFTSGPADGETVKPGETGFTWTASDDLAMDQACAWDGGEAFACDGAASADLTAGNHSLKVTITDRAGNSTALSRSFIVKKSTGPGPDPDPDPDPDTTDRTAPVVKLLAPRQTVESLGRALKLRVRCDEACSGRVVVKGSGLKFAGRVALARAGVAKLKLRPTARVRQRLLNRTLPARPLKLTARASLRDKAGNTGKATLKFRVAG
ncbi:MAG: Ig-like domain repeat protein [Solirubrobacterales bacterium]|nr:Ig-like domain repeat protein [Solirubrobacterales bacterium]